jgi:CheY-like chemotaxis protein
MGGKLEVSSQPAAGSCFSFKARFARSRNNPEAIAPADALVGLQVLVVADNETNRRVLAGQLRRMGCRYSCAARPAQAQKILEHAYRQHDPFAVMICDKQLHTSDSIELARELRSDRRWDSLHLMLMSSWTDRGDDARARDAGYASSLLKPIKASALHRELSRIIGGNPKSKGGWSANNPRGNTATGDPARRLPSEGRILLVEDNQVNRKLAIRMLEKLGLSADVVENGVHAMVAVNDNDYSLILMDCQMPEMDGYQATRNIRALTSDKAEIPIVAMTAHALQGDREKCLAAGMNDYIAKPITSERLAATLGRWLSRV